MKKMVGGFSRLSNHCSSVVFSGGRLEGLPLRVSHRKVKAQVEVEGREDVESV